MLWNKTEVTTLLNQLRGWINSFRHSLPHPEITYPLLKSIQIRVRKCTTMSFNLIKRILASWQNHQTSFFRWIIVAGWFIINFNESTSVKSEERQRFLP